jgi:hypothetical protein
MLHAMLARSAKKRRLSPSSWDQSGGPLKDAESAHKLGAWSPVSTPSRSNEARAIMLNQREPARCAAPPDSGSPSLQRIAIRFVLLIGVLSFFADFTYEGSRSILGPYLLVLGANAAVVGVVTGLGEMLGYSFRLVSGRWADATGKFWPITIFGYVLQMASVPALSLTQSWPAAAVLIILERLGKATRNPPRDVMLSHAAKHVGGYGLVFGIHEAMDQAGAVVGPLVVAAVLASQANYHEAFAVLVVPAVLNLCFLAIARRLYPRPQDLDSTVPSVSDGKLPNTFWLYLAGSALVAAGFADYPLIAYHFSKTQSVSAHWTPIFRHAHRHRRPVRAARFSRRFLVRTRRRRPLGDGNGGARIDHTGRRRTDDRAGSQGLGVWPLHRRLRRLLVRGQRRHRLPLRRVAAGGDRVLHDHPARGGAHLHPCITTANSCLRSITFPLPFVPMREAPSRARLGDKRFRKPFTLPLRRQLSFGACPTSLARPDAHSSVVVALLAVGSVGARP